MTAWPLDLNYRTETKVSYMHGLTIAFDSIGTARVGVVSPPMCVFTVGSPVAVYKKSLPY